MINFSKSYWNKIQSVLDEALDQPESQRHKFIKQACDNDMDLLRQLEALFNAENNVPTFLEQPTSDFAKKYLAPIFKPSSNKPYNGNNFELTTTVGPYKLCEVLGRGGTGIVYRAVRHQGDFKQEVAIKLLTGLTNNKAEESIKLNRFQQEQQTLASLNHPNIAQLYDGGLTEYQQAYIVMEYVKGKTINEYCIDNKLNIDSRLKLIMQVAKALDFAHKNLIVHRDIKPSNILINEAGQVKLLDFSIAKLLSQEHNPPLTQAGELLMTPGFAAPEQIKNLNITVATDIYQLGLVIYELLTGQQAFSDQVDSMYDLTRILCESTPTRPSMMAIATTDNSAENKKWKKQLQGDLDAIILKTLHNEACQRYSSMQALLTDIDGYFNNHVIAARKKNIQYQLYKFTLKHWRSLLVFSAFLTFLILYAITVTLQSQTINDALQKSKIETTKAQQVSKFMTNIFKASDPNVSGLQHITAQQLLRKGQDNIQKNLHYAPEIRSHMLTVLGEIYYSQGDYEKSGELLQQALSLQRLSHKLYDPELANILTKLAITYSTTHQYDKAEAYLQESLNIHQYLQNNSDKPITYEQGIKHTETLSTYAHLLKQRGDMDNAEAYFIQSINKIKSISTKPHEELAIALNGLAAIQHAKGQFESAVTNMRKVIAIQKQTIGETHSHYMMAINNLVTMLTDLEKFTEAMKLNKHSLSLQQQILHDQHPNIANTLRSLGILSHRQGDFLQAEHYLRQALSIKRFNHKEDNVTIAVILLWLGAVLEDMGNYVEADHAYQQMINIFKNLNVTDKTIGRGLCQIASLTYRQQDYKKAQNLYRNALQLLSDNGVKTTIAQMGYAKTLLALNENLSVAESLSRDALQTRKINYPNGHSSITEAQAILGLIIYKKNQSQEAIELLSTSYDILAKHPYYSKSSNKLIQRIHEILKNTINVET